MSQENIFSPFRIPITPVSLWRWWLPITFPSGVVNPNLRFIGRGSSTQHDIEPLRPPSFTNNPDMGVVSNERYNFPLRDTFLLLDHLSAGIAPVLCDQEISGLSYSEKSLQEDQSFVFTQRTSPPLYWGCTHSPDSSFLRTHQLP